MTTTTPATYRLLENACGPLLTHGFTVVGPDAVEYTVSRVDSLGRPRVIYRSAKTRAEARARWAKLVGQGARRV